MTVFSKIKFFSKHLYNQKHLNCVRNYIAVNRNILKLSERGLIQNIFPEERSRDLYSALISKPQVLYCGFDPTSDSFHIGNLLPIMILLHCQLAGHQPIALIGGATAQLGDPSGKITERIPISLESLNINSKALKNNLKNIFSNFQLFFPDSNFITNEIRILNNLEWYHNMNLIEFLSNTGSRFRIGNMLSRHSVQSRMNNKDGLGLNEFLYQVLQAFDWYHLYKKYNCTIQLGGNDQHGNILSGFEYINRLEKANIFGLLTPLLTASNGEKLGKSEGNSISLSQNSTSSFDFYQFFIRIEDSEVEKYLNFFTFLSDKEISDAMLKHKKNPENRTAQKLLAKNITLLIHGKCGLQLAQTATKIIYEDKWDELDALNIEEIKSIFKDSLLKEVYYEPGTDVRRAVLNTGSFKNEGEAINVIRAGGVRINNNRCTQEDHVLQPGTHILPNHLSIVRIGKKNYHLIKWLGFQ